MCFRFAKALFNHFFVRVFSAGHFDNSFQKFSCKSDKLLHIAHEQSSASSATAKFVLATMAVKVIVRINDKYVFFIVIL